MEEFLSDMFKSRGNILMHSSKIDEPTSFQEAIILPNNKE